MKKGNLHKMKGMFTNDKDECDFRVIEEPVCVLLKPLPGYQGDVCAGTMLFKSGEFYEDRDHLRGGYVDPHRPIPKIQIPADLVEDFNNGRYFCLIQPYKK